MASGRPFIERALDALSEVLLGAGIVVGVLMAIHVFVDVAAKYLLNVPLAGTLEIVSNYYMVGLIFAPLASIERRSGHIAADFLTRFLSARAVAALDAVASLAMAAFAALLVWRSTVEALNSLAVLEHIQTSGYFVYIFPARWLLPLGFGAMGAHALLRAVRGAARPTRG